MAARRPSWIFFRGHYLKKDSSNQFKIFIVYWDISEDLRYWISDRSEIQYGRQAAILDFLSRALSQEGFKQSIRNFYSLLGHIRGPALSNFRPVGNLIWPPGGHLGFSFARIISSVSTLFFFTLFTFKFLSWFFLYYIGTYFMMRAYQIVGALPCPPCNWRGPTVDSYESHRV